MLIKTDSYEIQTHKVKLRGRSTVKVNDFLLKTKLSLVPGDGNVEIVVPNTTGRLYIRQGSEEKHFVLLKNTAADLYLKGDEVSLTTNDSEDSFKISSNMEIVFLTGLRTDNIQSSICKKLLKLAKTPKTRYELFEGVLSPAEYHNFVYGSSKNRAKLYQDYLWPLVDAGLLKSTENVHRRYANLFQTV